MEILTSFLIAVMAGVACHYIIKWLDGDDNDNEPKRKPSECRPGVFACEYMDSLTSFCLLAL